MFIFDSSSGFKHMYKKKMMQIQAHQTVELMWSVVREKIREDNSLDFILRPSSMLHDAARVGNVEFVRVLLDKNPELLRIIDESGKSIFHVAVENRQERVFNLIYDMKLFNPDDLIYYFNEKNISLLELAVKRTNPSHFDRVSGAIFEMHRELLWFKVLFNHGHPFPLFVSLNLEGKKNLMGYCLKNIFKYVIF